MTSDICVLVKQKIDQLAADGAIEQLVSKAIEKAISEAVSDAFGRYGDFTKTIEKGIKETVKVDLSDLGIAGYNDLVSKILRQKLGGYFEETVTKTIEKEMTDLLADFPTSITVSELAEKFREYVEEEGYESGNFTFIVERNDRDRMDDYFYLYLDKEEDKDKHRCAYKIRCNKEGVWAVEIDDVKVEKKMFIGPIFNFERFLFHAYANKVIVTIDTDEPETYYGNQD